MDNTTAMESPPNILEQPQPNGVTVKDNETLEQLQLINELETEEKNILLKLIETFVSKKRFKDYLQKNIAVL